VLEHRLVDAIGQIAKAGVREKTGWRARAQEDQTLQRRYLPRIRAQVA
jgi:hypothetical protein